MWYIAWYLIIGLVVAYVTVAIHLYRAETAGYDAIKWWNEHTRELLNSAQLTFIGVIFGLFIWPIRLVQFISNIPKLYDVYDHD